MKKYQENRAALINKAIELTKKVYESDLQMINGMIDLTVELEIAEPNEEFVSDLIAFINYYEGLMEANDRVTESSILTTIFHDLGEFRRNRHENWFCPRSSGYSKRTIQC